MAITPKAKSKLMPITKKAAPAAKKVAPIAAKAAPAKRAAQRDIEDKPDTTLDLENVLAGCPTDTIIDALLAELSKRVDYVVESVEDSPEQLPELWLHAKRLEQHTIGVRHALEDAMVILFPVDEENEEALEGTETNEVEGFEIKIARKLTRKVDGDKLTELSEEYEIDDEIARLFRFKPELNLAVYRAEGEEMQQLFAPVITTKPGRPSFTITAIEQE